MRGRGRYAATGRPNDDANDELAGAAESGSRLGAWADLEEELELEGDDVAPTVELSLTYDGPAVPAPKPWGKWLAVGALGLLLLSRGR